MQEGFFFFFFFWCVFLFLKKRNEERKEEREMAYLWEEIPPVKEDIAATYER